MVWPSRRGLVDAGSDCSRQPASRRSRSAGSRPGGAVGRGAGRSGRAVGLRGFASPDVLKYRLAVLGVPVVDYSDNGDTSFYTIGCEIQWLGSSLCNYAQFPNSPKVFLQIKHSGLVCAAASSIQRLPGAHIRCSP